MNKVVRIALVTILMAVLFLTTRVMAQTEELTDKNPTPTVASVSEELDYTLPYPGILLDNPLYVFKNLRDRIMHLFLNNPVKRIEFSLLQSDKYLAMAMAYADMKKWDWAGKAIIESKKEMEQAFAGVITTRKAGTVVPSHVVTSLERSTVKHKQRIDGMKEQSQEKPNGLFGIASDAFAQLAAQASALREQQ